MNIKLFQHREQGFFKIKSYLCQKLSRLLMAMLLTERLKELRISSQLPQRKVAAWLDIDTATYCKIEKGERKAKKKQVETLELLFQVEPNELITLWLADKVADVVSEDSTLAINAMSLVVKNINVIDK